MERERPKAPSEADSLEVGLLLGEHSDAEVSILLRLEGRRHDQVLAWWQREAAAHFSQVDEGFGPSGGAVMKEEVPAQVNIPLTPELTETTGAIRAEEVPKGAAGGGHGGLPTSSGT